MRAIVVEKPGGPEALQLREIEIRNPAAGEARIRVEYSGINFIDVYHREGRYPLPLPFVPGSEGAGVVEAVGEGVGGVTVGQRVAWASSIGSYGELAVVPAFKLVPLPDEISFADAAAAMLQGMTAHYLVHSTWPLKRGETALVHAAAGGVGLLLLQMARRIGARVIGTVSTAEKEALAREAGADEVIRYTETDFESEVKRFTDGKGVDVVYDSVGRTTFSKGLNVLRPRGMMVLFGASSGAVEPFDPISLMKGSLYVTRPTLGHYTQTREELLERAGSVLRTVASGELKLRVEHVYEMAEAEQAHRDLEGRKTTGKQLIRIR
jgi:NADPH2:quinone reductase